MAPYVGGNTTYATPYVEVTIQHTDTVSKQPHHFIYTFQTNGGFSIREYNIIRISSFATHYSPFLSCSGVDDLSVFSSSWCLGRAEVCDRGTPWTFLLPFLYALRFTHHNRNRHISSCKCNA